MAQKISVVMPAYNEEKSIEKVILGLKSIDKVDQIVVADNNSADNTSQIAENQNVTVVEENKQGYGHAMKAALEAADGDIIISIESDQSYRTDDLDKLLEYLEEFDVVFGDRTNTSMIQEGAKMGFYLRFGNKFLGRLIQILFSGPRITDVGCSYRAFTRESLDKLLEKEVRESDLYSPQLIIEALKYNMRIIVVPVTYKERTGSSKLTNSFLNSTFIGLKMVKYIISEGIKFRIWK